MKVKFAVHSMMIGMRSSSIYMWAPHGLCLRPAGLDGHPRQGGPATLGTKSRLGNISGLVAEGGASGTKGAQERTQLPGDPHDLVNLEISQPCHL